MKKLLLIASVSALTGLTCQAQSYSNAVMALNPVGYWPLNESGPAASTYVATNRGTLGAAANGYYGFAYPDSLGGTPYTLFGGPAAGVTSDGDSAASFNISAAGGDPSGYMVIPHTTSALTTTAPFTAEVWVEPLGGDPNDPAGASYASTEWTSIIKEGYGGYAWGDNSIGGNGAGWSISLSGIYCTGYPVGWYTPGPTQLLTNATWIVDFFNGNSGGNPSLEFDVPMYEPTPEWFHLVLTDDGVNAKFYTNGVLAATTVPGTPASTNKVWAANTAPITSASGLYTFAPSGGVSFAADAVNPIVLGNINTSANFYGDGYPNTPDGTIGFNNQTYVGTMDEVALYTNALSSSQVTQHFADATASDKTLYTNDVLSLAPTVYLRLDEPAYTFPNASTFPVANNYGSTGSAANGLYQPGTLPGAPGPGYTGFGSQNFVARINGLDGAIDVANVSGTALDPSGNAAFSVSYWFKGNPADSYARFQSLLGRGDNGWRSSVDGSGKLRWNPGAGPELTSAKSYNDGAWHHFAGVTDGTSDLMYIDGVLSASNSPVGSIAGSPYDLLIGGAPDYTITKVNGSAERYFAGSVAQVAFFPTALTTAQVQSLYNAANLPPSIVTEPAASTVIVQGNNGTLTASASGTPPLSYQWYDGTTKVSDSSSYSGSATSALTIQSAQNAQSGSYTLVVTNLYGLVTSAVAVVTVRSSPTILQEPQPAATTVYAGNRVNFSVGAVGAAPLLYQWYNGSALISGATRTNYSALAVAGSNNYFVVVSNSLGAATSSVVSVTGVAFAPPAGGFAVNFNDSGDGAYHGLGVYQDQPADTNWNVFPNPPGGTTPDALDSAGSGTLVTLSMDYGFNNGANNAGYQGSPCFLVQYEAGVNSGAPGAGTSANPMGTFTFNDVPPGQYTLYVYSANYDGNRGSIMSLAPANGGQADGGTNATTNVQSDHTCDTMVEGDNYVFFHDVVPDAGGTISGSYIANPNGQLTGEGQIDALQLVLDQVGIEKASPGNVTITWSGGALQTSGVVTGPWTPVTGASPQTIAISGSQQFFRVY